MKFYKIFPLALLVSALVHAQETAKPAATDNSKKTQSVLVLAVPYSWEHFPNRPAGFTNTDLNNPIEFGVDIAGRSGGITSYWVKAFAYFVPTQIVPALQVSGGPKWNWDKFQLKVGLGFITQELYSKSPFKDSQFSSFMYRGELGFEYRFSSLSVGLDYFYQVIFDSDLANLEDMTTKVITKPTQYYSPYVHFHLPLGFTLKARADAYQLGASLIKSRDFGFGIHSNVVGRYRVGVAKSLDESLELFVEAMFVDGVEDNIENSYQARFLTGDHLLARKTVRTELRWIF